MWGFALQKQGILYLIKNGEMIYLKNISTSQGVFIPKCRGAKGDLLFSLKNTVNQSVTEISVVDEWTRGLYFKFEVKLPAEVASGEYEYSLTDDAGVLSEGILIVGESSNPKEYNKVIQYEQY